MAKNPEGNPIVRMAYSTSNNMYTTTLKDGQPGPNISLNDMLLVMSQLAEIENNAEQQKQTATTIRNQANSLALEMSTINSDLTENLPKVKSKIQQIKEMVTG